MTAKLFAILRRHDGFLFVSVRMIGKRNLSGVTRCGVTAYMRHSSIVGIYTDADVAAKTCTELNQFRMDNNFKLRKLANEMTSQNLYYLSLVSDTVGRSRPLSIKAAQTLCGKS